jgi:hypothetical protein
MMHLRRCALLLLFCACLSGQPAAPVKRELSLTRASDAGTVTIHLRNECSSPATGWIVQCETPQGGSRYHWTDQDLSFETTPFEPGKETAFEIRPRPPEMVARTAGGSCEDFHVIVAVFANGTVSGDLRWIAARFVGPLNPKPSLWCKNSAEPAWRRTSQRHAAILTASEASSR